MGRLHCQFCRLLNRDLSAFVDVDTLCSRSLAKLYAIEAVDLLCSVAGCDSGLSYASDAVVVLLADEMHDSVDEDIFLIGKEYEAGFVVSALVAAISTEILCDGAITVIPIPDQAVIVCLRNITFYASACTRNHCGVVGVIFFPIITDSSTASL